MATAEAEAAAAPKPARAGGFRTSLTAFETPGFRFLWLSNLLFFNAQFIFVASQQWLIVNLTDSRTLLGLAGFAQGVAMLVLSPFAGVVTDRVSRRLILMVARLCLVALCLTVAVLEVAGLIEVWHVVLVALVAGLTIGSAQPATQTFVFDVVPRDRAANAVALNATTTGMSQMIGPSLGGILIAAFGVAAGYFVSAGFYLCGALVLVVITVLAPRPAPAERRSVRSELREGAREALANPVTRWALFFVLSSIFGASIQALRPVFAKEVFDVGAVGFGLMSAVFGLGSVTGAIVTANLSYRVPNKGAMLLTGGLIFFGAFLLYSGSPWYGTTLVCEFVMGFGGTMWNASGFPLIQMAVPEAVRGRVMSLVFMIMTGAFMGQLLAGFLADHIGPRWTLFACGSVALGIHAVGLINRTFLRAAAKVSYE
ncbi:MAG: MFS transporter [Acidimicrobiia bacterium]